MKKGNSNINIVPNINDTKYDDYFASDECDDVSCPISHVADTMEKADALGLHRADPIDTFLYASTTTYLYDVPVVSVRCGDVPVVFHVPHAGLLVPTRLVEGCHFACNMTDEVAIMADTRVDRVAYHLSNRLCISPYATISHISRTIVDFERFDSDEEEMNRIGMGVVYACTHDLIPLYTKSGAPSDNVLALRHKVYDTYTKTVDNLCHDVLDCYRHLLIVDLHSYATNKLPYELHGDGQRPKLCVGTNDDVTSRHIVDIISRERNNYDDRLLDIGLNSPFVGAYCPLSLMDDKRVTSVMFELRKDSYNHGTGRPQEELLSFMVNTIRELVNYPNY